MARLAWDRLLLEDRLIDLVDLHDSESLRHEDLFQNRHAFEKDIGKLIYSYDFRRLLSKTQVYFFTKSNDYVRTRLVHALEVAILGRSLGKEVALQLLKNKQLSSDAVHKIGDILFASCLCHDIGNPPFGHLGENFIRQWFKESDLGKKIINLLPREQRNDFWSFDGNAQGLRVLTKQVSNIHQDFNYGLRDFADINLSVAVLSTFIKYPCFTSAINPNSRYIEQCKGGVMVTERQAFSWIVEKMQLCSVGSSVWCRHPLTFLMEAADDICYNVIDLEDAYKVGSITESDMLEIFFHILPANTKIRYQEIKQHNNSCMLAVSYLRSQAINTLGQRIVGLWLDRYEDIMNGTYHQNLLEDLLSTELMQTIKNLSYNKIYAHHACYQKYLQQVVFTLLDYYGNILCNQEQSNYLWYKLVSNFNCRHNYTLQPKHIANCLLDYFSGMTDRCAIRVFEKIKSGDRVDVGNDFS